MFNLIVESTMVQLLKTNIEKLSTTKISKMAGVSVGSFYQYFPNKEALFLEVAKVITKQTKTKFKNLVIETRKDTVNEEISLIVDAMVDQFYKNGKYLKSLYKFVVYFNQYSFIIHTRHEVAETIYEYLVDRDLIRNQNRKNASYILANSFIGVMHTYCLDENQSMPLDELKHEMKMLFSRHILYEAINN